MLHEKISELLDVDDEQKGDARENLSDGIEANFDWVIEKRVASIPLDPHER